MMELLKNAMRATMQEHIKKHSGEQQWQGDDSVTHQESFESLHSPLSTYQRTRAAVHESEPMAMVTNVDQIPPVNVIIADSPNNEGGLLIPPRTLPFPLYYIAVQTQNCCVFLAVSSLHLVQT